MSFDYRKVRRFLDLTQPNVSYATGIPVYKLSQAERGLVSLSPCEEIALRDFLEARLESAMANARFRGGHLSLFAQDSHG
jgi:hypothetical protein